MTIVKIKNPVLRWLVGFVVIAIMIVIAMAIFYGIGLVAPFLPFFIEDNPFIILWRGLAALAVVAVAAMIICGMYFGAKELGNEFFDP